MSANRTKRSSFILIIEVILIIIGIIIAGYIYVFGRINNCRWDDSQIYTNTLNDSNMDNYTTIALFGVDSRENELTDKARSDSIIIACIDKKTRATKLVSIYRDTYVSIPDKGFSKINHAYAYGGPKLAIETINMNFDLNITDFVTINFSGLTDVIDALGGITLTIEENELEYVNKYAKDVANINNKEWTEIESAGEQLLTGVQATGYSRVRYTKGGDFTRTKRQRAVIEAILQKAKHSNPVSLVKAADSGLSQIYTSLSAQELASLSAFLPFYSIDEQTGFPFDNIPKKINGADVILCDTLESNVIKLHEYLYGTTDYVPSDTIKSLK